VEGVGLLHQVSSMCRGERRFMLATRDAHGLYSQFGFKALANPSRMMEILDADAYQVPSPQVDPSPQRTTK
jgi:hypothetical protein